LPVEKRVGDMAIGATINKTGTFKFEATKVGKDTALAQIIRLVQEAQGSKPPIARMVDVIASYFVRLSSLLPSSHSSFGISLAPIRPSPMPFSTSLPCSSSHVRAPWDWQLLLRSWLNREGCGERDSHSRGRGIGNGHQLNTIVLDKTGTLTKGEHP